MASPSDDSWQRVEEIFYAALEQERSERPAFLAQACAGAPQLRARVEELIAAYEKAEAREFLSAPAVNLGTVAQPSASPLDDALIGRTLGEFVIRERLGQGGFGAVYLAEQPALGREAVVKVLREKHNSNKEVIKRFSREARLASQLEHPYTASVYAFGAEPDGLLWIAMELVRGATLDHLLHTQGPIALERFVPLLDKICEVIQTAHEAGIIHRDIKPSNVMVIVRAGIMLPKLLDFGIAKSFAFARWPYRDLSRPNAEKETLELDPRHAAATDECEHTTEELSMAATMQPSAGGDQLSKDVAETGFHTVGAIGTPSYMAPEQWQDAAAVSVPADIYALGVLSYEALTGRLPFSGDLRKLAEAHAELPLPPLGPLFPAALDGVLARAMAKRREDRYTSALEFAREFRRAAGMDDQQARVPQLRAELRERALTSAPQPVAEAIAGLMASRNAYQARENMLAVVRALLRYLGVVALSCRASIGSDSDTARARELLRKLGRQSLNEEEWLELTRELCRPFAHRSNTYPIPELVLFYERESQLFEPFFEKGRLGTSIKDEQLFELLNQQLEQLASLLGALAFLSEYKLIVPDADQIERWMGLGRVREPLPSIRSRRLEAGKPLLADAQGNVVISLWPFAQVGAPAPGARAELFFLEGKGRSGARLVAIPAGFERQDEHLLDWFRTNFFADGEQSEAAGLEQRAPYPGLISFTPADAAFFFGREREVESFLNRLRVQPLLAVVGASGAGKSSFVQAGVIPGLAEHWRAITVRPGSAPLVTLTLRLAKEGVEIVDLKLADNAGALGGCLRQAAAAWGRSVLLVVDQFEELFTLCQDAGERQLYAQALAAAVRTPEEPVRVIITLRDDFLMRAQQLPALGERLAQGLQLLATPAANDLVQILTEPARCAGYEFEDSALPREIVAAIAEQTGALPLLAFTAAKLWDLRDRQFQQLRRGSYEAMGGVGGALAQHAEEMMARMSLNEQRLVRELFRRLVTGAGTRATLTRQELNQVLEGENEAEAVIEKLIAARLLTASESESGTERVEIVHEALLEAWPRLVKWRREDAEGARLRDQLAAAARQWQERGRARGLLWRDEALAEYRLWHTRYAGKLTEIEMEFAHASIGEATRSQRNRRLFAGIAALVLLAGMVVLFFQRQQALEQNDKNRRLLYVSQVALAAKALEENNASQAVSLLETQIPLPGQEDLRGFEWHYLWRQCQSAIFTLPFTSGIVSVCFSPDGRLLVTGDAVGNATVWDIASRRALFTFKHTDGLVHVAFSPNGKVLATGSDDGNIKLWNVDRGVEWATLKGPAGSIYAVAFSRDGRLLASGGSDTTVKIWDIATLQELVTLKGHTKPVTSVAFSPDGKLLASCSYDATIIFWDTAGRKQLATLKGHTGMVDSIAFSPDGRLLASGSADAKAKLWDVAMRRELVTLKGHTNFVTSVAFSPDGRLLATGSYDRTTKLWDVDSWLELGTLKGHNNMVDSVAFSPDGRLLATTSSDNTAKVWNVATAMKWTVLEGHTATVTDMAFSPDSKILASASFDHTVKLWDRVSGQAVATLKGHKNAVSALAFAPDGVRLAAADHDAVVKLWDLAGRESVASFSGHKAMINGVAFSPDGKLLATASSDRSVKLWNAADGQELATLTGHTDSVYSVKFSPDGERLATGSWDKSVKIWDVRTRRELAILKGHSTKVHLVAFSPDGRLLASVGWEEGNSEIKLWDAATGREKSTILEVNLARYIIRVSFSPDSKRLIIASGYHLKLWDLEVGQELLTLKAPENYCVAISADGTTIATGGYDERVKLWHSKVDMLALQPARASSVKSAGMENPQFEQGEPGQSPPGWFISNLFKEYGYMARLVEAGARQGKQCALLMRDEEIRNSLQRNDIVTFGNLMQRFDGRPYAGKTVRYRAAVRVQGKKTVSRAQLWLRADRSDGQIAFFDNMDEKPITSAEWAYYEIVAKIDEDVEWINLGVIITDSDGQAWIDDASFEILEVPAR